MKANCLMCVVIVGIVASQVEPVTIHEDFEDGITPSLWSTYGTDGTIPWTAEEQSGQ